MEVIRYRTAEARCFASGRYWRADYAGLLTNDSAHVISRQILAKSAGRPTFERIDRAVTVFDGITPWEHLQYLRDSKPGVILVRDDQYEDTAAYCRMLAGMGVMRVPFFNSQMELAQDWLSRIPLTSG